MADITLNLSGTAQVDDSLVEAFSKQFFIAAGEEGTLDQFVTVKEDIGAKSISFTKYGRLALATTPLNEREEVDSEAMSDSEILLTPAEYGKAITKTKLASLQSGGKIDMAAARLVGINMGQTRAKLTILAAEASTNSLTVDGGAEAALDAADVMTAAFLDKLYNKLSRASIPAMPGVGAYVAIMHEDVIADLRKEASGGWTEVQKYAGPQEILKNEVGMLKGFRIVKNNLVTVSADAGALAVDTYKTICMGYNAVGYGVSQSPGMVITGPFDKLARFVHVGWHGCFKYGIVDQDALWVGITASSVGANA